MIRFGIHRREQCSSTPGPVARLLHGHRVSYRLLQSPTLPTAADTAIFDNIVYDLRLANGVYTTTWSGRFRDFDAWLTAHLRRLFPADRALRVEEWGASDAATSADWLPVLHVTFRA